MQQLPLTFNQPLLVDVVPNRSDKEQAVCLFSGGLDSAVLMWHLAILMRCRVMALTVNYGQRHAKELTAGVSLLRVLREQLEVAPEENPTLMHLQLPHGIFGSGSALLRDGPDVPHASYEEMGHGPQTTEVPFRNATFLSLATSMAMQIGAEWVAMAAHAGDHSQWNYPDCSPAFFSGMREAITVGTNQRVELLLPFLYSSKAGVVNHGVRLGVPFELTWSCYEGGGVHCGVCPTCLERRQAFVTAEVNDPTTYAEESSKCQS